MSWGRPTPTEALEQLVSLAVRPYRPLYVPYRDEGTHSCLCCGAKGDHSTLTHQGQCPVQVLRELVQETEAPRPELPVDVPAAYPVGARVRWCGGRTRRESTGLIEAVHQEPGWPAEYDVRVLWKDGRPGAQVQRRHHSELEVLATP